MAEWQAAWASDPGGASWKLLVARVGLSQRPGLLAGVVGVDLFERTGFTVLLDGSFTSLFGHYLYHFPAGGGVALVIRAPKPAVGHNDG